MPVILLPSKKPAQRVPIFFSHIPKTGGSSLEKYFQLNGASVQFFSEFNHLINLMKCAPLNHLDYHLIDQLFELKKFFFSFAIVRNPYARLASEFRFRKGRNGNIGKKITVYDSIEPWALDVLSSYAKDKHFFSNHIRPQIDFIGPGIMKVYKLELGLSGVVENISKRLQVHGCNLIPYESVDGLDDSMVTTKKTRLGTMSKEENLIRESSVISALVKHIYKADFDAFNYE